MFYNRILRENRRLVEENERLRRRLEEKEEEEIRELERQSGKAEFLGV